MGILVRRSNNTAVFEGMFVLGHLSLYMLNALNASCTEFIMQLLQKIFAETWEFLDYLQVRIAEAHPVDVGRRWFRELPWKCSKVSAEVTGRDSDHTIKVKDHRQALEFTFFQRLIDLVGPSCDSVEHSSSSWLFKIDLQRECVSFADRHDFNGESSNR